MPLLTAQIGADVVTQLSVKVKSELIVTDGGNAVSLTYLILIARRLSPAIDSIHNLARRDKF